MCCPIPSAGVEGNHPPASHQGVKCWPSPGVTPQMSQWFDPRSCCQLSNNGSGVTEGTRELSSPSGQQFPRDESCQNPGLTEHASKSSPIPNPSKSRGVGTQLSAGSSLQPKPKSPPPAVSMLKVPLKFWLSFLFSYGSSFQSFFLQDGFRFIWDKMLLKPCRNWQDGLRSCRQALFFWAAGVGEL